MSAIWIRLPDGNIHKVEPQNGQGTSLRNYFLSFGQHLPPYEVSLLVDENTNTLVSKNENLKAEVPYKLIDGRELMKCFNTLKDHITKDEKKMLEQQQTISDLQQKLNSQELVISKEEKQKLEEIQKKYLELESQINKEKEQNQQLQQKYDQAKQDEKQKIESIEKSIEAEKKLIDLERKGCEKIKTKYLKYKTQMREEMEKKSVYESTIATLNKEVEHKSEKIKEREIQITKLESQIAKKEDQIAKKEDQISNEKDEYKTNLYNQKIFYEQLINKEADRLKEAEQRHQLYFQSQNQAQLLRSTTSFVALQQNQDNNQDIEIQQDKFNHEQRIKFYDDQIMQLENQITNKDIIIKELTQQLSDSSKRSQAEKEELEQKILQLEKEVIDQDIRLKNLCKMIDSEDSEYLKLQGKVEQIETELYNNYKYRLMRAVELAQRTYKDQIEFAVEDLFNDKLYKKQGQLIDQTYKFYKLDCCKVQDIIFKESNLDFKISIISSHKFNIHGQLTSEKIVADQQTQNKSEFVDSLQIFYSKSLDHLNGELVVNKSEKSDKIYIIKETFTNQSQNIGSLEYTLDQLSRSIAAQVILNQFVEDLKLKKKDVPFRFYFAQPSLFSISIHFKQYFFKLIDKQSEAQQPKSFQVIKSLVKLLQDDKSNDFYSYIREQQHKKIEVQQQGEKKVWESDKEAQTNFLTSFIDICFESDQEKVPFKDIIQQINKSSNEEKYMTFQYLLDLLSETCENFPFEKYFYGYELNLSDVQEASEFKKYNGGSHKFDCSEEGKFFSALSYYSIKKSHYQFCVSHIQGIGNCLYDPVISSYDGYLNCFDQGINEIRNIESAFESCDHQRIGYKYIEALGITMQ